MKSALAYSLIFVGAFLVTVWLRAPDVTLRSAKPDVNAPAAAADRLPQAAPPGASAVPAGAGSQPLQQPALPMATSRVLEMSVDDPRDAISGDVYPIVEQVTAAADVVSVAQTGSLPTPSFATVLSRPAAPEDDQQRDAIPGDVYPSGQYTGSSAAQ